MRGALGRGGRLDLEAPAARHPALGNLVARPSARHGLSSMLANLIMRPTVGVGWDSSHRDCTAALVAPTWSRRVGHKVQARQTSTRTLLLRGTRARASLSSTSRSASQADSSPPLGSLTIQAAERHAAALGTAGHAGMVTGRAGWLPGSQRVHRRLRLADQVVMASCSAIATTSASGRRRSSATR